MKPIVQALLLADHVYQDVTTSKCIICGVFSKLIIRETPAVSVASDKVEGLEEKSEGVQIVDPRFAGSPYVYLNMIDGIGTQTFCLRYTQLENDAVFLAAEFTVPFPDKLTAVELIIPFFVLPRIVGTFALELLCDNEIIGSHKIYHERFENEPSN